MNIMKIGNTMNKPTDEEKIAFCNKIEDIVEDKDCSYMEAMVFFCEENDIEPTTVAQLLTEVMRQNIELEASSLNLIKSTTKVLPV